MVLVLLAVPVHAAESRFGDVRLIVGRDWNGGFDEASGELISDIQAKRLRFEVSGRSLFDVPFDRLRAGRYEESKYPPRSFRRSGHYLALHYVRHTGEPAFDVFRLPGDQAVDLLAVFERDAGLSIERGPAATSFLGLPVHLAVGSRVQLTGDAGGAAIDAGNRRQAYRRTDQRHSSRVEWRPMIGNNQKGVQASLRF
jgi:hypothetical protein